MYGRVFSLHFGSSRRFCATVFFWKSTCVPIKMPPCYNPVECTPNMTEIPPSRPSPGSSKKNTAAGWSTATRQVTCRHAYPGGKRIYWRRNQRSCYRIGWDRPWTSWLLEVVPMEREKRSENLWSDKKRKRGGFFIGSGSIFDRIASNRESNRIAPNLNCNNRYNTSPIRLAQHLVLIKYYIISMIFIIALIWSLPFSPYLCLSIWV